MIWLIFFAALFLSFSNGANDNFKGFATVWGSETLSYRRALLLATFATVAGSLVSFLLADTLVQQFSGKGLVPNAVANTPLFILSVASGAAATVFLATRLGFPVSTTHALIGGLVGAGVAQSEGIVHLDKLANSFLLPLLVSPILAAILGVFVYRLFRTHPVQNDCACLTLAASEVTIANAATATMHASLSAITIAESQVCDTLQPTFRFSISKNLDRLHILSAMAICFARGVNDTPKLAALLIASHLLAPESAIVMIAIVMALGGFIFARKVAETMSQRVTRLDHPQGLAANLITASLVLFASKFGLPVSTTHVAIGAIAGVGASAHTLNWDTLRNVLLSWVATLPCAAAIAWLIVKSF